MTAVGAGRSWARLLGPRGPGAVGAAELDVDLAAVVMENCGRGAGWTRPRRTPVHVERKIGVGIAVLGSLLVALSGAAPAFAGSGSSAGLARLSGVRFAAAANSSSTSFAGWEFGAKAAKSVTTEFKVPTPKCTKKDSGVGPLAVTLSGKTSSPSASGAGLLLECISGSPAAAATVIVNGTETNDTTNSVAAGDLMKATVTISASKTTTTIADLTKGHTFTFTQSGAGGKTFEELIIDDSLVNTSTDKQLPVLDFGTISYSNAAISGKAIGSVKPQTAVNMETSKKVLQILTGKITGKKKNAFTTTWKHS
jgi:Peptidase A4 family